MALSESEKLRRAELFVRKALSHLGTQASERDIHAAAVKVAKCLPPFRFPQKRKRDFAAKLATGERNEIERGEAE